MHSVGDDISGNASTDIFTKTNHGLSNDDIVFLTSFSGGINYPGTPSHVNNLITGEELYVYKINNDKRFSENLNFDDFWIDLITRFNYDGQEIYSHISTAKKTQCWTLDGELNLKNTFLEALSGTKKNLLVNDEFIELEIQKEFNKVVQYLLKIRVI